MNRVTREERRGDDSRRKERRGEARRGEAEVLKRTVLS
jgi:hypothetical protein